MKSIQWIKTGNFPRQSSHYPIKYRTYQWDLRVRPTTFLELERARTAKFPAISFCMPPRGSRRLQRKKRLNGKEENSIFISFRNKNGQIQILIFSLSNFLLVMRAKIFKKIRQISKYLPYRRILHRIFQSQQAYILSWVIFVVDLI